MNQGLQTEIKAAIGAHGLWRARLFEAIDKGKAMQSEAEVKNDRLCQFGKWMQSLDPAARRAPNFAVCSDLHARFHTAASHVVALALAGKKAEATKAMGAQGEFGAASSKLVTALMAWAKADAAKSTELVAR